MAEIEIVYLKGFCDKDMPNYCGGCHSELAEELGLSCFDGGGDNGSCMIKKANGGIDILYGNCAHAKYHYIHKGCTAKRYEIHTDSYDRKVGTIPVTINTKTYECTEVKLNGKRIFDSFDEEWKGEKQ